MKPPILQQKIFFPIYTSFNKEATKDDQMTSLKDVVWRKNDFRIFFKHRVYDEVFYRKVNHLKYFILFYFNFSEKFW